MTSSDGESKTKRATLLRIALALLLLGLLSVVLLSICSVLGGLWWLFDLCTHFCVQYAVVALLVAAGLAGLRQWRWAGAAAVICLFNAARVAPLFWGGMPEVAADSPVLDIVVFNAHVHNRQGEDVASYLAKADADVVILIEATPTTGRPLRAALHGYEEFGDTRFDAFGMLLFTRLPVTHSDRHDFADSELPALSVVVEKDGVSFAILGLHTMPPVGAQESHLRNAMLDEAAAWARSHEHAIIAGDLNATPWSAAFDALLASAALHNSQRGFGVQTSWPAKLWPLSIPIDHVLHTQRLRTMHRRVGPFTGSDHRPVHVRIGLAPK